MVILKKIVALMLVPDKVTGPENKAMPLLWLKIPLFTKLAETVSPTVAAAVGALNVPEFAIVATDKFFVELVKIPPLIMVKVPAAVVLLPNVIGPVALLVILLTEPSVSGPVVVNVPV